MPLLDRGDTHLPLIPLTLTPTPNTSHTNNSWREVLRAHYYRKFRQFIRPTNQREGGENSGKTQLIPEKIDSKLTNVSCT